MTVDTENRAKDISEDLIFLLSLSKEDMEDVVNVFLEFTNRTSEISLDAIMNSLIKVNKIGVEGVIQVMLKIGS